ncbi:hypothetical protein CTAYLR_001065 [Chrysophaeum taylorii]|uniref:Uncharacterized protein n=1 Tax=Chrysophaeum taylorii TaxID=2483200 RepID=A0AAD7UFU2_9STRA|nr:hypothetical protein CTAYLR_001065 [Chrysophaeum taylorii]
MLPAGTKNVFIQNKNFQRWGLVREATGRFSPENLVAYKQLDRKTVLEEVERYGVMCDFAAFKAEIEKLPEPWVLVVADPEQQYGDFWRICLTSEAAHRELGALRLEAEKQRAIEEEEETRRSQEEAKNAVVYEDAPVVAKPYMSRTGPETEAEVAALTVSSERPLLRYKISRDRSSVGAPCSFGDREADNEKYLEHRAQKNPDFELQRRERDASAQARAKTAVATTQTTWYRPMHRPTQYETITEAVLSRAKKITDAAAVPVVVTSSYATPTQPQHFSHNQQQQQQQKHHHLLLLLRDKETRLAAFLSAARPTVEEALQQNETVDVFADPFHGTGDDDLGSNANKGENELKELRTFNDIVYSKNMSLAAIDWHPTQKSMIAVAPVRNLTFEERIATSGRAITSYILLWDFVDLIHPQLLLETPREIQCFRFNPDQPHLVAAGAANGQVILWDVGAAMSAIISRQNKNSMAARGGNDANDGVVTSPPGENGSPADAEEEDDDERQPAIKPEAVSNLDQTHRRVVTDLCWLPAHAQVNFRGQLLEEEEHGTTSMSNQFLTVSGDGQVMVWDVRYKDIAEGKLPRLGRKLNLGGAKDDLKGSSSSNNNNNNNKPPPAIPWYPLFKMQLKRLEGVGDLSICRVCHGIGDPQTGLDDKGIDRRSEFLCSSEEGEIMFADWRARATSTTTTTTGSKEEEDDGEAPDYVQWMAPDHGRPALALEQSPFLMDVVLSVGDSSFQLWKIDRQRPIFSSPHATSSLTCGCWSPTRPGMLYMARADGALDVWDLTDSSYRPSAQLMVAPTRITSIKFLASAPNAKQQLLAIGDKAGNLHVFDVPRTLSRPAANEKTLMLNFIDEEIRKIEYVTERRQHITTETLLEADDALPNAVTPATPDTTTEPRAHDPNADFEFSKEELETMNAAYEIQRAKFAEMMGITLDASGRPVKPSDVKVQVVPKKATAA